MFTRLIVSGIAMGCLYALIALGFNMIWNTAVIINFAQAEFAMASMFFVYTLHIIFELSLLNSIVLALFATALLGYLTEKSIIKPIINRDRHVALIITMGFQIVLTNGAQFIWGTHPFFFPSFLGEKLININNIRVSLQNLWIIFIVTILVVFLYYVSTYTRIGKALRAVSQDREIAWIMGINVNTIITFAFVISVILSGISGILMAPIVYVQANIGLPLILKSMTAAVIGGFGSYPGAILGGVLIGIIDNLSGFYISTSYRDVITFSILILILYLKPNGLLNKGKINKV